MAQTMLIIDDDPAVLASCQRIFTEEGFQVTTTTNPLEGLELAAAKPYTVILCDWQMPELDGLDVVARLENEAPESAVVMISGFPSVDRATEAMKRGAMDYQAKPFTPEEIASTVHKAIANKLGREKKALGRFESILKEFPTQMLDDKGPKNIAETVAHTVGVAKATSAWKSLFVLGMMAGAYIGFGGLLATTVSFDMNPSMGIGLKKLVTGSAFSLGLMLVVIAGGELFTGNNLMVSSVMSGKVTWRKVLAKWGIVYLANFAGSILLVMLFLFSGLWKTGGSALGAAAVNTAAAKVSLDFGEAIVRAIGCNWLVCLAVWMALSARQTIGKIFAIFFPIMGFVAIGFEHCIANMYFIPAGILLSDWYGIAPKGVDLNTLTWAAFVFKNLIPVTIGNVIGGVVFVGLGYWGAYLRPAGR
ncbi:Protein with response regulator receiver domain [Desulfatibacillum aliphaticivorans]|uniref:Protein with response regulator receiver domain n=1 Tax=Desulfatibacillum aliphaticivorans TaxID=218208 RepID=B8FF43_DESAL|nr:formate/nitrite family transporter [Desulfatibacillum aliphaticivorans]ACL03860.1 Protein with response regulator receiver domain [Desulfatibacillum aliphaticivorans]